MVKKLSLMLLILFLICGCAKNPPPMVEIQDFAMDTYFRLVAPSLDGAQVNLIKEEVARLDHLFNRFSPDSDISRINENAGRWLDVKQDTIELLAAARELAAVTDGYYDPTIGPLVELWQIVSPGEEDENDWRPPAREAVDATLDLINYQGLALDPERGAVCLDRPGMKLDVGGIAKGYAVDRVAQLLRDWQVTGALIDFGGDYYALGRHPEGRPWKLGIRHPREPETLIAYLTVENQAVTTSGDYQRFRTFAGQRYSHLLNPKNGYPARGLTSVTIVAPTGTAADALATAVFILGPERGKELVESLPEVEAVLIDEQPDIWVSSGLKDHIFLPPENRT